MKTFLVLLFLFFFSIQMLSQTIWPVNAVVADHWIIGNFQMGTPNNNWKFHEGIDIRYAGSHKIIAARTGILKFREANFVSNGNGYVVIQTINNE